MIILDNRPFGKSTMRQMYGTHPHLNTYESTLDHQCSTLEHCWLYKHNRILTNCLSLYLSIMNLNKMQYKSPMNRYLEKEWVTYEDEQSITQKIEYLKEHNIGGLMISSQSEDDFSGAHCSKGPFPLSRLAYEISNLGESDLWKCESWEQYCSSTLSKSSPTFCVVAVVILLATR